MNLPENTSAAPADWPPMRVGEGWDTHALVPGRPLILGGVRVPHTHGLAGHSDADALLHAITDAVLGAAGLGDIGTHFPDTDAAFAGADSHALLQEAGTIIFFQVYRGTTLLIAVRNRSIRLHQAFDRDNGVNRDFLKIRKSCSGVRM